MPNKTSPTPIVAVSQYLTRNHGQGKINLELLVRLHRRGWPVQAFAAHLEQEATKLPGFDWQQVRVPQRVPSNWLRCELFRRQAQRRLRSTGATINNGAAAIVPSQLNIAMFVHTAWLASAWHPRHASGLHSKYLTAFSRHSSKLEKLAFEQSQLVVALSDTVRQELIEYCQLPEQRVITVVPGVDCESFRPRVDGDPGPLRKLCEISDQDDRMLLLFVGEIRSRRKNLDLVLRAMVERPDTLLAVIGDTQGSPYPDEAAELGLAERVCFLGYRKDVSALMPGADAFVFPTHYEPFGLVVSEAMGAGLPVVTTRQAGAACVVDDGCHGRLLDDGDDLEGLVGALDELADPARRQTWGAAARQKAESLTWDRMADQYETLLEKLGVH